MLLPLFVDVDVQAVQGRDGIDNGCIMPSRLVKSSTLTGSKLLTPHGNPNR